MIFRKADFVPELDIWAQAVVGGVALPHFYYSAPLIFALRCIRNAAFVAMGNLHIGELIVIFAIILLLFGGKKLPALARSIGQGINEFKKGISGSPTEEQEQSERDVTPSDHQANSDILLDEPPPKAEKPKLKKSAAAKPKAKVAAKKKTAAKKTTTAKKSPPKRKG